MREYLWLGMLPLAYVDWSSGSAVTYYVHTDQVMVPQKLTNSAKAVVFDRVAEPFGVEISATGSLTQALRFPGQRHDLENGFAQNWHRDYDPFLGRYVQSDPIGLMGGINTYAYVEGNPLLSFDPEGLQQGGAQPPAIYLADQHGDGAPIRPIAEAASILGAEGTLQTGTGLAAIGMSTMEKEIERAMIDGGIRLDDKDGHRYQWECKPRIPATVSITDPAYDLSRMHVHAAILLRSVWSSANCVRAQGWRAIVGQVKERLPCCILLA